MWEKIKKNYYDIGIRMFWLDEAEPEIDPLDYENVRYLIGNGLEVSSIYPYNFAQALYEGQTEAGQKDVINLIRCAWIGSQRFGAVVWSGDIYGDFATLRRQIKAGLNISLCGIPWWNTDIGGFFKSKDSPEKGGLHPFSTRDRVFLSSFPFRQNQPRAGSFLGNMGIWMCTFLTYTAFR